MKTSMNRKTGWIGDWSGKCSRFFAIALLMVLVSVLGMNKSDITLAADSSVTVVSQGTESGTKVYYYNEGKWDNIYIWAWTMKDNVNIAKGAWPGDKMTDVGNGWYSFDLPAGESFGVLFNDGSGNQTANCNDIEPGKTCWCTNAGGEQKNDSGLGGGVSIVANTQPKAGWPEGPAEDTIATNAEKQNNAETIAVTSDNATSTEKENNHTVVYVVVAIIGVAIVIGGVVLYSRKKGNQ